MNVPKRSTRELLLRTGGMPTLCFPVGLSRAVSGAVVYTRMRPREQTADEPHIRRMPSSGMLRRVALVRTDILEELCASIIRVTRIGELGTTLAVTSNRRTL
jgi:hypothetical protein